MSELDPEILGERPWYAPEQATLERLVSLLFRRATKRLAEHVERPLQKRRCRRAARRLRRSRMERSRWNARGSVASSASCTLHDVSRRPRLASTCVRAMNDDDETTRRGAGSWRAQEKIPGDVTGKRQRLCGAQHEPRRWTRKSQGPHLLPLGNCRRADREPRSALRLTAAANGRKTKRGRRGWQFFWIRSPSG